MNKIKVAMLGVIIFPTLQFTYHNSVYDTPKLWPAFGVRFESLSKLFMEFDGSVVPYRFSTPSGPIVGSIHEWTEMRPTLYAGVGTSFWKSAGLNLGVMKNKYEMTGFIGLSARMGGKDE